MSKFHMLDTIVFTRDIPEHKITVGDRGQVTQMDGKGKYWVQVGEVDTVLVPATEQDINFPLGHKAHYSEQLVHCNHCGKSFMTDFNRFDGRVCSPICHKQVEWKRVLSMMGSDPKPLPAEAEQIE